MQVGVGRFPLKVSTCLRKCDLGETGADVRVPFSLDLSGYDIAVQQYFSDGRIKIWHE